MFMGRNLGGVAWNGRLKEECQGAVSLVFQAFSGGEKCDGFHFVPRKMRIVLVEEDVYHWNCIGILRVSYTLKCILLEVF